MVGMLLYLGSASLFVHVEHNTHGLHATDSRGEHGRHPHAAETPSQSGRNTSTSVETLV